MRRIHNFYIAPDAVVTGEVHIGEHVNIWYGCIIRGDVAAIHLEPRVNVQDGCIVHADYDAPLVIEEGVVIGHGAILHGRRVGRDSLIGIGARLLAGSEIGSQCIVAAGAVVVENSIIPARSVVMGIPGRVVRQVSEDELAHIRKTNAFYLELAQRYAAGAYPAPWSTSAGS
ncbi:MAG: gamma carbonic anhydrase family protein [Gemmataceae bacterium]